MFRHKGKRINYTHNLRLSFVAGLVIVSEVMQLQVLTSFLDTCPFELDSTIYHQ